MRRKPEVAQYLGDQQEWSSEFAGHRVKIQAQNFKKALERKAKDCSNIVWLVHTRAGEFIGTVLLTPNIPRKNGILASEISVALQPQFWSERVSTEVLIHIVMFYKTCNILRQASATGKQKEFL